MNKPDVKKLILLNLPYVFAFYFADKIAAVFRLAPGAEFIDKLTNGFAVFGTAFANPLPSFHPVDLLIGLIAGALLKMAVYVKGKNRKKFRQGEEYGSARWGAFRCAESEAGERGGVVDTPAPVTSAHSAGSFTGSATGVVKWLFRWAVGTETEKAS